MHGKTKLEKLTWKKAKQRKIRIIKLFENYRHHNNNKNLEWHILGNYEWKLPSSIRTREPSKNKQANKNSPKESPPESGHFLKETIKLKLPKNIIAKIQIFQKENKILQESRNSTSSKELELGWPKIWWPLLKGKQNLECDRLKGK